MPRLRHLHSRFIAAPPGTVRPTLDALWSGTPLDAFPWGQISRWRKVAEGERGFSLGTRFGHGPFKFTIDRCDDQMISARIDTPGYVGFHRFELHPEGAGTRVVHDLQAVAAPVDWMVWTSLVGAGHDWAVRSCLARLESLVTAGHLDAIPIDPVPWRLRAFISLRALARSPRRAGQRS